MYRFPILSHVIPRITVEPPAILPPPGYHAESWGSQNASAAAGIGYFDAPRQRYHSRSAVWHEAHALDGQRPRVFSVGLIVSPPEDIIVARQAHVWCAAGTHLKRGNDHVSEVAIRDTNYDVRYRLVLVEGINTAYRPYLDPLHYRVLRSLSGTPELLRLPPETILDDGQAYGIVAEFTPHSLRAATVDGDPSDDTELHPDTGPILASASASDPNYLGKYDGYTTFSAGGFGYHLPGTNYTLQEWLRSDDGLGTATLPRHHPGGGIHFYRGGDSPSNRRPYTAGVKPESHEAFFRAYGYNYPTPIWHRNWPSGQAQYRDQARWNTHPTTVGSRPTRFTHADWELIQTYILQTGIAPAGFNAGGEQPDPEVLAAIGSTMVPLNGDGVWLNLERASGADHEIKYEV